MTEEQKNEVFDRLCELNAADAVRAFLDYHGMQLIDLDFAQFLSDDFGIEFDFLNETDEEEE